MKTDLQKILSISGEQGLFQYISHARNGMIAESLLTKKRSAFGPSAKVSALTDISVYTDEDEINLKDVLKNMKEILGENDAPTAKSSDKELKDFFAKAIPGYDADRFYVSHMKKIVGWYNCLKNYASLDFVEEEEAETTENQ